jgi:hypothetical protein
VLCVRLFIAAYCDFPHLMWPPRRAVFFRQNILIVLF